MNGFITLKLRNRTTDELTIFDYDINLFSHVVRLMIDDLSHCIKTNDPYDIWLEWTNTPPVDVYKKCCLQVDIIEKDFDIHHTYNLYLQNDDIMRNLQLMLFSIVNDSEIDFKNKKNLVWEVLTW